MLENNLNKYNATINIKQRQYPFSAIRNPLYNNNSHRNNGIIITNTITNNNIKNIPVKIKSKPSSGTVQPSIRTPVIINEKKFNPTIIHHKPSSSHKKDFLMNQIISHNNKLQGINCINYPPIHNFKTIPRNPFKNAQITSIKNIVFQQEHKPNRDQVNLPEEYNDRARSVAEYAYKEDMNTEHRKTMEDFHKIIDNFCNDQAKGFFAIFDGHGGTEPIKYIKDRLPEIFGKFLYDTNFNVEKSFIYSFQKIDDEVKCFSETENVGCTATVVFIFKEYDSIHGNRRVLYCANVGDSRSVLIRGKDIVVMTTDHKCSQEKELERIKAQGGIVFNSRLFGQLALSRALGDHSMKSNGLICTPDIYKRFIDEKDKYVIIASDGIWDTVSNDDLIKLSSSSLPLPSPGPKLIDKDTIDNEQISAKSLCKSLIAKALEKGSYDNISCLVIKL